MPDISIWFSALEPGSRQWSPAEQRSDDSTRSEQNPILFAGPASPGQSGALWLLPVVLPSGRWLIPTFRCITTPGEMWVGNSDDSAVMISDDDGLDEEQGQLSEPVPAAGFGEGEDGGETAPPEREREPAESPSGERRGPP